MLPSLFSYAPECVLAITKIAMQETPSDTGETPDDGMDRQLPKHPALHAAKTIGGGALGLGVGTLAGYGAGQLARRLTNNRIPAGPLIKAGPVLGGLGGLAYTIYKQRESEELNRALQAYRNKSSDTGA